MKNTLKGGVWTNVEDEILKVAVMKYGKNQWARISSLLVRKTPKQCKARWNEWLDPRIKKTEWSKEEDEKLLHLAKVFPSQWGTISDLVGRTAQMCLERYERLLDAVQAERNENKAAAGGGGEGEGAGVVERGGDMNRTVGASEVASIARPAGIGATLQEARRLRPGEIDPSPESKPARPDPVDMDEDEKEMLAEARARLANTQGKKAKRKAREKLLEEARRLAALQKRRELLAAGLPGVYSRIRGMNYNAEIPFERKPAPGLYDTTDELAHERGEGRARRGRGGKLAGGAATSRRSFTLTKDAIEMAARKKDVQKQKARMEQGYLPTSLERKLKEQQALPRTALNLPAPQISDVELEQIAKIGYAGEAARLAAVEGGETPASATLWQGPSTTPLHSLGRSSGSATPMSSTMSSSTSTTRRTPLRDQLGINNSSAAFAEPLDAAFVMDAMNRRRLRDALKTLPMPKNDFEIVLPEASD